MTNKYPGTCTKCGGRVAARAGRCWRAGRRWLVAHLSCEDAAAEEQPRVIVTRFNSGTTVYRNSRGRCEDAPCCGCCS